MAVRHVVAGAAIAAATFVATRAVYSDEAGKKDAGGKPSDEQMWKEMTQRAAPVEEHAKLAALAGTWDADVTCTCSGEGEQKSKGTLTAESLLGGRVLFSKFKGEMGGHPFEGIELQGYDKEKKQNWTVWCDSMGTSYLRFAGARNGEGNVATTSDEFDCMGTKYVGNAVTKVVDADHVMFDMVNTSPGQPDQKMSIRYTRRK